MAPLPCLVLVAAFALGDAGAPRVLPETSTLLEVAVRPRDPFRDPLPKDPALAQQIQLGYRIFTETARYAPRYTGSALSCSNCHLNAGQRDGAMPVVGVAAVFPEPNARSGRLFSLQDRVVSCFLRSLNGANAPGATEANMHENAEVEPFVSPRSPEVLAVAAYVTWLSEGAPLGQKPVSRGVKQLAPEVRIPIARLSPARGKELYGEYCQGCHGEDGQGVDLQVAKPGPLWGPGSWNDGASLARTWMLAGMIRHAMPYLGPGSLTDEEAQLIAAYITSQPRPHFRAQAKDYASGIPIPEDAVYDTRRFPKNPLAAAAP
jgi:thiosulfate dehydrogenase